MKKELRKNVKKPLFITDIISPKDYLTELKIFRDSKGLLTGLMPEENYKLFSSSFNGLAVYWKDSYTAYESMAWSKPYAPYWVNDALKWHCIKWAKKQGFKFFDLAGIGATEGIQRYKAKWGGQEYGSETFKEKVKGLLKKI